MHEMLLADVEQDGVLRQQTLSPIEITQVNGGCLIHSKLVLTQKIVHRRDQSKVQGHPPLHSPSMADAPVGK
ncbi:hypothetical protein [Chitinimonas sp. BJB300]|uniref:hypothetical protein n=1 Tax=Chitinimonas sp. BJB300 TaxID=1559339 RepID=UPI000C0DFFDF|nr:hypothetical protein [Chitinimonas sp. BJB300]PHV09641.1 hypothetical protein CSQ89_20600 [Chitinimonas sp. BJB300]TSJ84557.1 hypothetical protein FG002_019695 [Chitinimonas sp. BJB300]